MSLSHGSSIIRDGLVFHYDMSNTKKSWKGRPTSNLPITIPSEGTQSSNLSFTRSLGRSEIIDIDSLQRLVPKIHKPVKINWGTTNWTDLKNSTINTVVANGQTIHVSLWVWVDPRKPSNRFNCQLNITGYNTNFAASSPTGVTNIETGKWKRLHWAWTNSTGTNYTVASARVEAYAVSAWTDSAVLCYGTNFQVEILDDANGPSPWVDGSRSNTEALIDLTGNQTITANSLTYNSDGTFKFNGTSDYMNAGSISQLNGASSISFDAWLKVDNLATTDRKIICYKRDADTNANFQLRRGYNTDGLYYQWHNSAWQTFAIDNFFDNTSDWHHVTIVHNPSASTQVICYKNGEQFTTYTGNSTAINWLAATLFIGYRTASEYFDGNIPNVKIYNRALSPDEVKRNFEATRGRYGI